jgi:IS605 OrfB family transposase
MIKSTTSSLKFANSGKQDKLHQFIDEYRRVVGEFVNIVWDMEKVPQLLPKEITSQVKTWLSARMLQCAGKQASGIVRGTQTKQKRRLHVINKLKEQKLYKRARKLQKIYDEASVTKPNIVNVCPELDSRFVDINLDDNETTFDGWVKFGSIGNKLKLHIPFKKTKHFNKMLNKGELKTGIRLSKKQITFMFDIEEVSKKETGSVVGIDIGQTTTISCSNGHMSSKNIHGHDLSSITTQISRCKKGSNGFRRAESHRKNYINWSINQLNLDNVKEVKLERIKNMRKGRRTNRRLSHWTYADIFSKIESKCEEQGVLVTRISPTYTSKRCSKCGWTRRNNRKGKEFKCSQCGFTLDADLNASRNIAANLKPIGYKKRQLYDIKTGFWWPEVGEEPIVPLVTKTLTS